MPESLLPAQPPPTGDLAAALALARIESKLDRLVDRVADLVADKNDHETRLRVLESRPVVTTKMLTTVVFVGTAIASVIPIFNLTNH